MKKFRGGRSIAALPGLALLLGCSNLDSVFFLNRKLDAYQFEDYQGEQINPEILDELGPLGDEHITQLTIQSGDERLAAVLLKPPDLELSSEQTLLVLFHGSSSHLDYYWPRIRLYYAASVPVLAVDYRGYGTSTGEPTMEGVIEDGHATLRFVAEQLGDPRVIIYSNSLGTIVACEMAASQGGPGQIARFALEAVMGNSETFIQNTISLDVPDSYAVTYDIDNRARIRDTSLPLWWLHGDRDEQFPIETHGWPVWESYREVNPGQGWHTVVAGGTHTNLPVKIGVEPFIAALEAFVWGGEHALLQ